MSESDPLAIYPNCGTDAGYYNHYRKKTERCDGCIDAHAEKIKENKDKPILRQLPTSGTGYTGLRIPAHRQIHIPVEVFFDMYARMTIEQQNRVRQLLGDKRVDAYQQSAVDINWNNAQIRRRNAKKRT